MKRDMNLVREILLIVENISLTEQLYSGDISIDGYDTDSISYHCKLMIDHDLIAGQVTKYICDITPNSYITGLTWEGHDFLDACRDETRWKKATEIFKQLGGAVSIELAKETLKKIVFQQLDAM